MDSRKETHLLLSARKVVPQPFPLGAYKLCIKNFRTACLSLSLHMASYSVHISSISCFWFVTLIRNSSMKLIFRTCWYIFKRSLIQSRQCAPCWHLWFLHSSRLKTIIKGLQMTAWLHIQPEFGPELFQYCKNLLSMLMTTLQEEIYSTTPLHRPEWESCHFDVVRASSDWSWLAFFVKKFAALPCADLSRNWRI